ncbi:hypothetical protein BS47DRAFT_1324447 [Hydnum rufescens UP504]|uniref:Zn(2)-C6 fungal-type domain-containing protein n=1 Tax=Hydnum rufescens UP504 TaxID=1448309 RepID=A0A9P6B8I7_9AGAM|nr:hypothetical protein BS47DRAFT_1324447 [Hydnum rufescens UP504]
MDPASEAGKGRRRAYLACRQCRSRKIKCDATHPVCLTCVRRKSPKCEYDDEPRRRGPDRHPRIRTHQDSGAPPSIRPRRSQKRVLDDVVSTPITPSTTQSPPYITSDASATPSDTALSNTSPVPPRGPLGGIRLYPSPSTSTVFREGSVNETPTHDVFGGSPSMRPSHPYLHHSGTRTLGPNDSLLLPPGARPGRSSTSSAVNSINILHPEPSPSTGTRDQSGYLSSLLNPSDEHLYPNFSPRGIVDTRPHNPYLLDNDPRSSSESRYSLPVTPMQLATGTEAGQRRVVRSPPIFASSSLPISRGTNIVHSAPSIETYLYDSFPEAADRLSPFAYNTNFLPMAASRMHLVPNFFGDVGNDQQGYEDADESEFEELSPPTPDTVGAHSYEILDEPSVEFSRQMWWESLTRYYGGPRAHATRRITNDLSHLFRVSNSMVSFINIPLFFSAFHHPDQREHVQPSLVFAMLALSTLLRSSNIVGLGQTGRVKALELRDLAQSHFDMSLNSGWITPDLAQAALLLVMFEGSCHPVHSEGRVESALFLLDSLILGLGLLDLDKEEYNLTTFSPNSVPSLFAPFSGRIGQAAIGEGATKQGCSCSHFQLAYMSPPSRKITPLWLACPGWSEEWSVVETRREEQRRLVWNTLTFASGYLSGYDSSVERTPQSLSIAKPWNFNVFFPGETLFGPPQMQDDLAAKHSVWALYSRCYMLYTSCLSMHHDESITEYDKGQIAVQAWLECERIERMLNKHTCDIERGKLYFGRQILFDTKNLVSSRYSRYVPHPSIGGPHFHWNKAMSWLGHPQNIVQQFLGALSHITDLENALATQPHLTFWFNEQLARYLDIWQQDPTLRIALDLCVQLLPVVECLIILFPSSHPRQKYEVLHQRLVDACIFCGIPPPSPPSYIIP